MKIGVYKEVIMKKRDRSYYNEFYKERAEREDLIYDPNHQKNHTSILNMLDSIKEKIKGRALDIGCGDGIFLDKLGMKFGESLEYYGVDVSDLAINNSKKKGFNNVYVVDLSEESLPFDDGFFSYVFIIDVIEHLRDPEKILSECYRVLNSSGTLIISTPNFSFIKRRISYIFGKSLYKSHWYEHIKFFNFHDLNKLLENSKFKPHIWNSYSAVLPFFLYKSFGIKNWININQFMNLLSESLVVGVRKKSSPVNLGDDE